MWSILGAGRNQIPLATIGAAQGHERARRARDSLWIAPGTLAESSASQVLKMRQVLEGLSLEIATPAEARAMLALKGDAVNF